LVKRFELATRLHSIVVQASWPEKKQVLEDAKRHKLSLPDYVRMKLALPIRANQGKKPRNKIVAAPEEKPYIGDPDNAVDVEELAREIWGAENVMKRPLLTLAEARREAKRRLKEAAEA